MSSEHCYFPFVNWIWNHLCKIFSLCLLIWLFVCLQARMMAVLKVYATSAAATDMGFLCVRTNWYGTRRGNCPEREAVLAVAAACQVWVVLCPTCHAHLPEPPRPTSLRPPTWSQPPQASPRKNNCNCLIDFCVTFMHVNSQLYVVVWRGFVQIFSCLWLEMSHLSSCSKSGYSSEEELWKALVHTCVGWLLWKETFGSQLLSAQRLLQQRFQECGCFEASWKQGQTWIRLQKLGRQNQVRFEKNEQVWWCLQRCQGSVDIHLLLWTRAW